VVAEESVEAAMDVIQRDNAAARALFLHEWPVITEHTLASMAAAENDRAFEMIAQWQAARRIFSVPMGLEQAFPALQFENGQPRALIAEVLGALPAAMAGWQIALWFVGSCGWLAGQRPVDCLDDQVALVEAAGHAADEWLG
jgi:hypothetical protein